MGQSKNYTGCSSNLFLVCGLYSALRSITPGYAWWWLLRVLRGLSGARDKCSLQSKGMFSLGYFIGINRDLLGVCFEAIPSSAQVLLLALRSCAHEAIWNTRDQT